jgi:hypothetical protein
MANDFRPFPRYRTWLFLVLLLIGMRVSGQVGGESAYQFLHLPASARQAALGGNLVPVFDNDLGLVAGNPALLNPQMNNQMVLNFGDYFAGIHYGYVSYSRTFPKAGSIAISVLNVNYGDFTEADELGNILGDFGAKDYAYGLTWAMPLDSFFQIGVGARLIHSRYAEYSSSALASDLGLSYHNRKHLLDISVVVKNVGRPLSGYYEDAEMEELPYEIEVGLSKRLGHAPFRFFLTAQQMQAWSKGAGGRLAEPDPFSGEVEQEAGFVEKAWRHMVVGAEFIPSRNFYVNLGYNALRRYELKLDSRTGLVGFSWGFGMKISKFRFSYGRGIYSLAGATNHISLGVGFADFQKKK